MRLMVLAAVKLMQQLLQQTMLQYRVKSAARIHPQLQPDPGLGHDHRDLYAVLGAPLQVDGTQARLHG